MKNKHSSFKNQQKHPLGYIQLFKLFQFYGPLYAILPMVGAVITAYERVHTKRHLLTDVVGGGLLAFLASEGVRLSGKYAHNHPLYKKIMSGEIFFNISIKSDENLNYIPFLKVSYNF